MLKESNESERKSNESERKSNESEYERKTLFKNPMFDIKTKFKESQNKIVSLVISHNLRIQCLLDKFSNTENLNFKNCAFVRILIDSEDCLIELGYDGGLNNNPKYYNNTTFKIKFIQTSEILINLNLTQEDINSKQFVFYIMRNCQTDKTLVGAKIASLLIKNNDKINYIFSSDLKKTISTIISLHKSIVVGLESQIKDKDFFLKSYENYIYIEKLIILPCSHKISTKGNGTGNCDEAASSRSFPNRPDCLKINIESEEKNDCNNIVIQEGIKSIPIDWDFYFNFYGNKMRGENTFTRKNINKNSCRNTNIISLIINYVKDSNLFGHVMQESFNQEIVALIDVDHTLIYNDNNEINTYLLDFLNSKKIHFVYLFSDMRFTLQGIQERYTLIQLLKKNNIIVIGVITPPDILWLQMKYINDADSIQIWNGFLQSSTDTNFIQFLLDYLNNHKYTELHDKIKNYNLNLSTYGIGFSDSLKELKNTQNISESTAAKGNISKMFADQKSTISYHHVKGLMMELFLEHKPKWVKSIFVIDDNIDVQQTISEFKSDIPITLIPMPSEFSKINEVDYNKHYLDHTQKLQNSITQQPTIQNSIIPKTKKGIMGFFGFGGRKTKKNKKIRKTKKSN